MKYLLQESGKIEDREGAGLKPPAQNVEPLGVTHTESALADFHDLRRGILHLYKLL